MMPLLISNRCCPKARGSRTFFNNLEEGRWRNGKKNVTESTTKKPIQDLREWLERVEEYGRAGSRQRSGKLRRGNERHRLPRGQAEALAGDPFDNIKGYEKSPFKARSLWNILGPSISRIALTMEEPPDTPTVALISRVKDKLKHRTPPREVPQSQAGFYREYADGRSDRFNPVADPEALAIGWRALRRYRGLRDHARS